MWIMIGERELDQDDIPEAESGNNDREGTAAGRPLSTSVWRCGGQCRDLPLPYSCRAAIEYICVHMSIMDLNDGGYLSCTAFC